MENNKFVIFDIETCANTFIANFLDYESKKRKSFIFYKDINVLHELIKFIKLCISHNYYFIGFNSIGFDSQIISFILKNYQLWIDGNFSMEMVVSAIYAESQRVINIPEDKRPFELIPEFKLPYKNIDLFKQKHYDRKQKSASLKWIQFSMRYPNIEEQPYHHADILTYEQILEVCAYCWNDVDSTYKFFTEIKFETDLRFSLTEKFGINLLNASEPKIARDIFAKFLCEEMNISYKDLKKMQTFRSNVYLKDIILSYIKFKSKELTDILNYIKSQRVEPNNAKFQLDFKYGGLTHYIGLGGIHSCVDSGIYEPEEDELMIDLDVKSFYPNLAIENDLKPEHLGKNFNKIYKSIYDERQKYDKKDPINYVYKIILNSLYGLSKEPNSYVYDPKLTYSITINGQLSLLMFYEDLYKSLNYFRPIQCNTDGITIVIKKNEYEKLMERSIWWQKLTRLELEQAEYTKMIIRDVNNYIAIDNKGNVKKKGVFETSMDYHKNPSFLIIPKAIEAYFTKDVPIEKFINEAEDIYDFCGGIKKKRDFDLNLHIIEKGEYIKKPQQKVTRFFVSNRGGQLLKDYHDGRQVSALKGYNVETLNNIQDFNRALYDVNLHWYIKETKKIISVLEANKRQLKLF